MSYGVGVRSLFILFLLSLLSLLAACGGGGGGGGGGDTGPKPATGSMLIGDVDADDDGLIEIANLQQLDWIRNDPTGRSLTDGDGQANARGCRPAGCYGYELTANLDFDTNGDGVMDSRDTYFDHDGDGRGAGWNPIGQWPFFSATFEGNQHTIRNLYVNRPKEDYVGLFGQIETDANSVVFRNVALDGPLMSITGKSYVGSLAGSVLVGSESGQYELVVRNCRSAGRVTGYRNVGGLIGYMGGGNVTLAIDQNVSSTVVTSDYGLVGGLIGWILAGEVTVVMTDNSATGAVTGVSDAGGLLGALGVGGRPVTLKNNFATGGVFGSGSGGLAGRLSGSGSIAVENCYATGAVSGEYGGNGGLIGSVGLYTTGQFTIENSYATGAVAGEARTGGLIGAVGGEPGSIANIKASYALGAVGNAQGSPQSWNLGGLIGVIEESAARIEDSFAAGTVNGSYEVGGLLGAFDSSAVAGQIAIVNTFASGSASGVDKVGGLVGNMNLPNGSSLSVVNNLALGNVSASGMNFPSVAGLIGSIGSNVLAVRDVRGNYFAWDTTGQILSTPIFVPTDEIVRAFLAQLRCPTAGSDTGCAVDELYNDWELAVDGAGNALWNFGSTAQLPGLRVGDSIYRPDYDNGAFAVVRESL